MPLTRNQLNCNKPPIDLSIAKRATKEEGATSKNELDAPNSNESSSSTPRLRDRRSLAGLRVASAAEQPASTASTAATTTNTTTTISPGPSSTGSKRPSSAQGPTRVLPKRSCGKPESLLAKLQPKLIAAELPNNYNNKSNTCHRQSSLTEQQRAHTKKDTHKEPQSLNTQKQSPAEGNGIPPESSDPHKQAAVDLTFLATKKTANARNYSRDVALIKSPALARPVSVEMGIDHNANNRQTSRPVCITLPDNVSTNEGDPTKLDTTDGDKFMITINGLRKLGTTESDSGEMFSHSSDTPSASSGLIASTNIGSGMITSSPRFTGADKNFNILVAVTGSVAAIKLVALIKKLKSIFPQSFTSKSTNSLCRATTSIRIVMTENSKHFISKEDLIRQLADSRIKIYEDADEWNRWAKVGDPVLHIELRKWADLCVIAPLDANTMAKLASGICDNLLTCLVRAWDVSRPLIYCPAMNVHMYNHPLTREHLCKLQSFGYLRVDCVEKRLACGDVGMGGMAPVDAISEKVVECLLKPVSRNAILSRPLLNQQPTYPIISTSAAASSNKASAIHQVVDRLRPSNHQLTLHSFNNVRRTSSSLTSANQSSSSSSSLQHKSHLQHAATGLRLWINKKNQNDRRNHVAHKTIQNRPNIVTSLQNLKAIDSDCNNQDFDGSEVSDLDMAEEDLSYDMDPSNLLEQTMVTDDLNEQDCGSLSSNGFDSNSSALGDVAVRKPGSLTPLFNTSKFLALCMDKTRGCYTCAICKNDYKNRKSMARHLKEQHVQGNIYSCAPCGVSYKRKEKLIKHNRERHGAGNEMVD